MARGAARRLAEQRRAQAVARRSWSEEVRCCRLSSAAACRLLLARGTRQWQRASRVPLYSSREEEGVSVKLVRVVSSSLPWCVRTVARGRPGFTARCMGAVRVASRTLEMRDELLDMSAGGGGRDGEKGAKYPTFKKSLMKRYRECLSACFYRSPLLLPAQGVVQLSSVPVRVQGVPSDRPRWRHWGEQP